MQMISISTIIVFPRWIQKNSVDFIYTVCFFIAQKQIALNKQSQG